MQTPGLEPVASPLEALRCNQLVYSDREKLKARRHQDQREIEAKSEKINLVGCRVTRHPGFKTGTGHSIYVLKPPIPKPLTRPVRLMLRVNERRNSFPGVSGIPSNRSPDGNSRFLFS